MKNSLKITRFAAFISLGVSAPMFAASLSNPGGLAGGYTCSGYDRQDKVLSNTTIDVTFDAKNSMAESGYEAYTFRWSAPPGFVVKGLPPNLSATGIIVSNGSGFALSFKNSNPAAPTDYGIAIGVISHMQDSHGISDTVLHFFGYQPVYKGGDNSTWTCTKMNSLLENVRS